MTKVNSEADLIPGPEHTTPGYLVAASLRGAINKGYDPQALLQQVGIDPEILSNPGARIASSRFARLLQNLWLLLKDEFLGFGQVVSKPGTFATMSQTILPCHNLEHALKRANRFYQMFDHTPAIRLKLIDDQLAQISIDMSQLEDHDHYLTLCAMGIIHRFGSWLIGERVPLIKACFDYSRPDYSHDYQQFFTSELEFDQDFCGFIIPRKHLAAKLVRSEVDLKAFIMQSPNGLMFNPDDNQSFSGQVRKLLGRDFSENLLSLEEIAELLHMTPQTLRRRLKDEGASFQDIKDQLRRDLAIYYLNDTDLSVQEITEKLGFAETSNFHRAFKKWTGTTPRKYRLT